MLQYNSHLARYCSAQNVMRAQNLAFHKDFDTRKGCSVIVSTPRGTTVSVRAMESRRVLLVAVVNIAILLSTCLADHDDNSTDHNEDSEYAESGDSSTIILLLPFSTPVNSDSLVPSKIPVSNTTTSQVVSYTSVSAVNTTTSQVVSSTSVSAVNTTTPQVVSSTSVSAVNTTTPQVVSPTIVSAGNTTTPQVVSSIRVSVSSTEIVSSTMTIPVSSRVSAVTSSFSPSVSQTSASSLLILSTLVTSSFSILESSSITPSRYLPNRSVTVSPTSSPNRSVRTSSSISLRNISTVSTSPLVLLSTTLPARPYPLPTSSPNPTIIKLEIRVSFPQKINYTNLTKVTDGLRQNLSVGLNISEELITGVRLLLNGQQQGYNPYHRQRRALEKQFDAAEFEITAGEDTVADVKMAVDDIKASG